MNCLWIAQISPELRHKLIEMFERRMKMNLRHAPEEERAHWSVSYQISGFLLCMSYLDSTGAFPAYREVFS